MSFIHKKTSLSNTSEFTNPVPNPGFEELNEKGLPIGWTVPAKWAGSVVTIDTGVAHTGNHSIKIVTHEGSPFAYTRFIGLRPGGVYNLSGYIRAELLTDNKKRGAGFKIEHDISPVGDYVGETVRVSTNGEWVKLTITFEVPFTAKLTRAYVRLYCGGTAWFDDIEITEEEAIKYRSNLDKVFLYPDDTDGGTTYVMLKEYYHEFCKPSDIIVDFELLDSSDNVIDSKSNVAMDSSYRAEYNYDVSLLTEFKTQYRIHAAVKNKEGVAEDEFWYNIYKYNRPASMTDNNRDFILKDEDGNLFHPIIVYHAQRVSYPYLQEANITVVQTSYSLAKWENGKAREATLNELYANGMRALFTLYINNNAAGHPSNIEHTKKIVKKYKDDPRIFAWAIQDEPLGSEVSDIKKQYLEDSYRTIRDIDDYHPIYVLDAANHAETSKYGDIYATDIYRYGGDTSDVSKVMNELAETIDKPVYNLAKTFQKYNETVLPSSNDIRNSIYRTFESGARGAGYFSISDAVGVDGPGPYIPLYETDLWDDFVTFNTVELPILFALFINGKAKEVNHYSDGDAVKGVRWYRWISDGNRYIMAHNQGRGVRDVTIPVDGKYTAVPLGLTKMGKITGEDNISLILTAEEIRLYKIEAAE